MKELETEEKILYSIEVLKKEENCKLILKEFKNEEGKSIWAIVMNYTLLDGKPQESIIGILENTKNIREKAKNIADKISEQLKENLDPKDEFKAYLELKQYLEQDYIPFEFTLEGLEIISCKCSENIEIKKTIVTDGNGKLQNKYPKEKLIKQIYIKENEIINYAEQKKEDAKWNAIKESILRNKSKEEADKFLKGEEIAKIIQRTEILEEDSREKIEKKIQLRNRIVGKYLDSTLKENDASEKKQNSKTTLANLFITLKEEALAEDANKIVNKVEKALNRKIEFDKGAQLERDFKDMETLESYRQFFSLLENGRDLNARIFAVKIKSLDLELMEKFFENFAKEDRELNTYLKCKKDVIYEIQTNNLELQDSENYISVEKLNKFLLEVSIRDKNRASVEQIVFGIFEQYKSELIQENEEEIAVYNNYATKHGRYVCPTAKDEEKRKHSYRNEEDESR